MKRHNHGEPTLWRMTATDQAELIAKRAIRHLIHYSKSPALLLGTMTVGTPGTQPFPCQRIYEETATEGGCSIRIVVVPNADGFDHRLFLVRELGLSDEQVMACRPGRT